MTGQEPSKRTAGRIAPALLLALPLAMGSPADALAQERGRFYVRGDLLGDWTTGGSLKDAKSDDRDAVLGRGVQIDLDRIGSLSLGAGAGYHAAPGFRLELSAAHRSDLELKGRSSRAATRLDGRMSITNGMLTSYADLAELTQGEEAGWLRPYLGLGLGVARVSVRDLKARPAGGTLNLPGGSGYGLAWSVGGGVGIVLTDSLTLDVGYRYLHLGTFETDRGTAVAATPLGRATAAAAPLSTTFALHEAQVGLRYRF